MKKSLVLTGMMGAGKSTVGKMLSSNLKMKFIDIDEIIEGKEKISIKNIFSSKGEAYFRELEKEISLKYLKKEKLIISLGGGAFINPKIRSEVLNNCISFWLDVSIPVLANRVGRSNKRPLIKNENLNENLHRIFLQRKNVYKLASYRINCDKINKKTIVSKIKKIYEKN